jgi:hypothetical protein
MKEKEPRTPPENMLYNVFVNLFTDVSCNHLLFFDHHQTLSDSGKNKCRYI